MNEYMNVMKVMDYSIVELKNIYHFNRYKNLWQEFIPNDIYHFTLSFEWFFSTWKSMTGWKNVRALIVIKDDEIISIIPLVLDKNIESCSEVVIPTTIIPLITKVGYKDIFLCLQHYLDSYVKKWESISFEEVDTTLIEGQEFIDTLESLNMNFEVSSQIETPILISDGDYESYISNRKKKINNAIGNNNNKLKKIGDYQLKIYSNPDEILTGLNKLYEIDCLSWKFGTESDLSSREGQLIFYETLALELSKKNQIKICILEFEETQEPIAFQYIINIDDKVLNAKHSYKECYREFSPGVILRDLLVRHLLNNGIQLIDTWSTKDRFKMIWCNSSNKRKSMLISKYDITKELE